MIFNFKIENFIQSPTNNDNAIKIYDKYGKLVYSINPDLAYFFYKNNLVIIKVDDEEDITLDFETNSDAINALSKLNDIKKVLIKNINNTDGYYLKTELNNGVLDNRYYTSAQTDLYFSQTGHSHFLTELIDVNVSGLSINEVLAFNGSEWVNSSFTFDLSSWEINYFTSSQTLDILSGYSLTSHTHNDRYYQQDQFSGSSNGFTFEEITNGARNDAVLDWKGQYITDTGASGRYVPVALFKHYSSADGDGFLDDRYYTQLKVYNRHEIDNLLSGYTSTGSTNNLKLEDLVNVQSGATNNQVLSFDGSNWIPTDLLSDYYSSGDTLDLLSEYSLTSHTHNNFYTKSELDNGILDLRYETSFNLTGGTLDWLYVKNSNLPIILSDYSLTSHTHNNYSLTSHTHPEYDNSNYYTSGDTLDLLSGYSLTSHTHNEYSLTSHTHDENATKIELTGGTLDWLYVKNSNFPIILSGYSLTSHTHSNFYEKSELFTSGETLDLFDNYLTSGVSDARYLHYGESYLTGETYTKSELFTSGDTLDLLSGYSLTSHTHNNFYEKSEIDTLLTNYIPLSGSNNISGDLIPSTNGTINLGSSTNQWASLYVSSSTIYVDNKPLTIDENGNLIVDGVMIASTAHTHDDRYYTQDQFSGSSIGYTLEEIGNHIGLNDAVLDWNGEYITDTGATGRYFPIALFRHTEAGGGAGILDNRYYTQLDLSGGTLDWRYLKVNTLSAYTTTSDLEDDYYDVVEINDLLDHYYTSSQTDIFFNNYYTSSQTDTLFLDYATKNELTGGTLDWRYIRTLELDDYYTSSQTDDIFSNYLTSAVSDARYVNILELDNYYTSSQTNALYSLTAHTHDDRYYTKIELNTGATGGVNVLDNRYLVKTNLYDRWTIDTLFLNYYTSSQTDTLLTNYYTTGDTINILSGYSLTSHTHTLSGLTDVILSGLTDSQVLVYSAGTWMNSGFSLNNYYTINELDNGALDTRYYTSSQTNDIFYTSAQTNDLFFNSAQTITLLSGYSLTSHTHDDRYYQQNQFSGSSSGYTFAELTNGAVNDAVLDWTGNDLINNFSGRYFPVALFKHNSPGGDMGVLDDRYCTKVCLDARFNAIISGFTGATWSGSSVLYENYTPVPEDLGGVETGDIFPSGTTIQNVLDQLLYPYQSPSFNSFTNGLGGISEIGTYIPSAIHTHKWNTTNSSNISSNTIEISGYNLTTVTGLNNNSTNSGETDIYISGFTGTTSYSWTIKGTNTNSQNFTRNINMSFQHKKYWGRYANDLTTFSGLTDSAKGSILQGLNGAGVGSGSDFNSIKSTYNGINGNDGSSANYLMFAYVITSPYTIQFKINGLPNTAWNYTDFSYTNSQGYSEIYRVYMSNTAQNSPIALFEIF